MLNDKSYHFHGERQSKVSTAALLSFFTIIGLLTVPGLLQRADGGGPHLLRQFYDDDCLPSSEYMLGAIAVYDAEGKVKKLLGEATRIEQSEGEDDGGGGYTLRRLFYKDVVIDIIRGKVDRLYTASQSTQTPSGIHPGLTLEQTIGILGSRPQNGSNFFYIATCPEKKDGQDWDASIGMSLSFDERNVLVSVEIAADRP